MLMRMPGRAMVSVLVLTLMAIAVAMAQSPPQAVSLQTGPPSRQMPARDRPIKRTGTGRINGRIVDALTGQPLVHAAVRLSGPLGQPTAMVTDASGTFAFNNLPTGSYYISATKPGYLNTNVPDSSRSLRRSTGLNLDEGQTLEGVTIAMSHGSAIVGRLFDAYGDPAEFVSVQVVRAPNTRNGRGGFQMGMTNDAGEFRVGRLEPGSYLVFATPRGRPGFEDNSEPVALVPTFYPGVLSPDQAQPLTVERGQTLSGIEFQVLDQPMSTITGLVLDASGRPATNGNVTAQMRFGIISAPRGSSQIHADGSFELKLPPGEYRLMAYLPPPEATRPQGSAPGGQRPMPLASGSVGGVVGSVLSTLPEPHEQQQGVQRLTVGAEAMANVVINAGYGGTISGRIVFDGDAPPPAPAKIRISGIRRPMMTPASYSDGSDDCRGFNAKDLNADLTFTIENVRGTCALSANVMEAGGWRARSAMYRGVDLIDRPVEMWGNQSVRDVVITLTNKRTDLSADVTDDQGAPTLDYVLVAFSTEKDRWPLLRYVGYTASSTPQPSTSAQTATAVAALSGSTRGRQGMMTSLLAGDYYVIAIDDATQEDIHDPIFLEQLVPSATRVTLREGEPQKPQLRRVKAPARQ
jgi:hypothetical protein